MKARYVLLALVLVVLIAVGYLSSYRLESLQVVGCNAIDEQAIVEAVGPNIIMDNTLFTYFKLKFNKIEGIAFLDKADAEITDKNTLTINVYEKRMAGCVEYMNYYIYFDKDGIVLEASGIWLDNIPCVQGMNFENWEMGEKLPIDDEKKFQSILSITQLVEKYGLDIDNIIFTADNEIVLTHEKINIELGGGDYLAIQMMNLGSILEGVEGLEGTLYMKDFDSDKATASFSKK